MSVRARYYSREEEEQRARWMAPAFNRMKAAEVERRAVLKLAPGVMLPDAEASALNGIYESELARIISERNKLARLLVVECGAAAAALDAGDDSRVLLLVKAAAQTPGRLEAAAALDAAAVDGVFFPRGVPEVQAFRVASVVVEGAAA